MFQWTVCLGRIKLIDGLVYGVSMDKISKDGAIDWIVELLSFTVNVTTDVTFCDIKTLAQWRNHSAVY